MERFSKVYPDENELERVKDIRDLKWMEDIKDLKSLMAYWNRREGLRKMDDRVREKFLAQYIDETSNVGLLFRGKESRNRCERLIDFVQIKWKKLKG